MEEDGFHLAKFEVSSGGGLMGCHDPFDLAGDEMMYIYKTVEEHKGVVALDVGDIAMASHQPWSIMEIARKCPDLKVVVCHLLAPTRGWEREWKLSLELLNLPNVWFDIAAIPKIMAPDEYPYPVAAEYLQMAKEILTAKKFMWGTDAPFAATQDTYEHLTDYLFKNGAFTEEELEDVYYNNAELVYFSK
jgi:predicted TIM-barrel fold metal-dependent hydrolase